jgi:thiol-disulfide isomerase/thioredoxin
MKKLLLIASAGALLSLAACKKENNNGGGDNKPSPAVVPQTQQATVFYFGGTWCPPCGAYGKPTKDYLKSNYAPDKFNLVSCQVNSGTTQDPMNNASANALAATFGVTGVPTMYFGSTEMPFEAVGGGTSMQTSASTIMDKILARTPIANGKFTTTVSGNDVTVKVETQFFKAVDPTGGTYKIAAYLTEDGLNHTQSNDAGAYKNIHDNVLRATLGASASGDVLTNQMDQWGVKNFTLFGTLNGTWKKETMKVVVVLWKQAPDNKLTCVNSWSAPLLKK